MFSMHLYGAFMVKTDVVVSAELLWHSLMSWSQLPVVFNLVTRTNDCCQSRWWKSRVFHWRSFGVDADSQVGGHGRPLIWVMWGDDQPFALTHCARRRLCVGIQFRCHLGFGKYLNNTMHSCAGRTTIRWTIVHGNVIFAVMYTKRSVVPCSV